MHPIWRKPLRDFSTIRRWHVDSAMPAVSVSFRNFRSTGCSARLKPCIGSSGKKDSNYSTHKRHICFLCLLCFLLSGLEGTIEHDLDRGARSKDEVLATCQQDCCGACTGSDSATDSSPFHSTRADSADAGAFDSCAFDCLCIIAFAAVALDGGFTLSPSTTARSAKR